MITSRSVANEHRKFFDLNHSQHVVLQHSSLEHINSRREQIQQPNNNRHE